MPTVKRVAEPTAAESEIRALAPRVAAIGDSLRTEITCAEDAQVAAQQLSQIHEAKKQLEVRKHKLLDPALETVSNIRELFRPLETRLEQFKDDVGLPLADWNREQKERLRAKEEQLAKKVEAGTISQATAAARFDKAVDSSGVEAIKTRKIKKLEIFDAKKIPDEYWVIDEVALRRALLDGKKVPGARMVEEETIIP